MAESTRGPGPVATFHRLLIVTAFVAAILFAIWEIAQFARTGGLVEGIAVVVSVAAAVTIGIYLRSLRGLAAKLTPRP